MLSRIIIILAVNVILFARTIKFSYVSDDLPTFKNPPKFKNKWHKLLLWLIASYKWKTKYDHLMTLIIHALVGVFIYTAFGMTDISFFTALLFCVNPANNQGSVWISGRGYVLPPLLLLISLSMPFLAPFTLWAMGYFNLGFVAPLSLIGSNKAYLLAIMPFIWFFWFKKFRDDVGRKIAFEQADEDRKLHFGKFILAIKTMGFYATLGLIPFRITFYHSFLQSCAGNDLMKRRGYSMKDKFFWIGLGLITLFIYLALQKWTLTTYGLFWFFINILPFSNLKRLQQEIAERYLYTPLIGLMLALTSLIINYPIIIAIFLTMYIVKFNSIMRMYMDDYWILETAVIEDHQAWFAWHMRGIKRWDIGSYKEALTMWVMAKLISPKEFKLLYNIAVVLRLLRKDNEAQEYFNLALANIIKGQEDAVRTLIEEFKQGKMRLLT